MSDSIIETAKTRRLLAIKKKLFKEDLRQLRHRRMSRKPVPLQEHVHARDKTPAA